MDNQQKITKKKKTKKRKKNLDPDQTTTTEAHTITRTTQEGSLIKSSVSSQSSNRSNHESNNTTNDMNLKRLRKKRKRNDHSSVDVIVDDQSTDENDKKQQVGFVQKVVDSSTSASTTDTSITYDTIKKKFVMSSDGPLYEQLMANVYRKFVHVPALEFKICHENTKQQHQHRNQYNNHHDSTNQNQKYHQLKIVQAYHKKLRQTFESMYEFYNYDIVMAGGKHLSRTFVKRCLVGVPGITYKYLGLRLFAHAWSGVGCSPSSPFASIYQLNQDMIQMTKRQQEQKRNFDQKDTKLVADKNMNNDSCNCNYNLTLINYMEPSMLINDLKDDPIYGMGKVSVSWHADSSLQSNTCIGVYHTQPLFVSSNKRTVSSSSSSSWDWKIALRPNPPSVVEENKNTKGTNQNTNTTRTDPKMTLQQQQQQQSAPPPIVIDTQPGDAYFLLDEMNETHQHMVLSGSVCARISSTHRVAVTEHDTFEYISNRIKRARKLFKEQQQKQSVCQWDYTKILFLQEVLTEVEFEWIEQYWIQGTKHDKQHVWWQGAIRSLEGAWVSLEQYTYVLYQQCCTNDKEKKNTVPINIVQGLVNHLIQRQELRIKWDIRRSDKIYKRRIDVEYQPVVGRLQFPPPPPASSSLSSSSINHNQSRFDKKTNKSGGNDCTATATTTTNRLQKDLTIAIETLKQIIAIRTCHSSSNKTKTKKEKR